MMTGNNLTDIQLQQIVNRTILYLDKDSDGQIGLDEFTQGKFEIISSYQILTFFKLHSSLKDAVLFLVIVDRGTESGIWSILGDTSGRV